MEHREPQQEHIPNEVKEIPNCARRAWDPDLEVTQKRSLQLTPQNFGATAAEGAVDQQTNAKIHWAGNGNSVIYTLAGRRKLLQTAVNSPEAPTRRVRIRAARQHKEASLPE